MKDVVVAGAGKIGSTIALMLAETGDYRVTLVDRDARLAQAARCHPAIAACALDVSDAVGLRSLLEGRFAILSAAPFHLTLAIAEAAAAAGVHYLDLTEDVASTRRVRQLAEQRTAPSRPSAALLPASFPSWRMHWHAASTRWTRFACGSAPCRNFRPGRSATT